MWRGPAHTLRASESPCDYSCLYGFGLCIFVSLRWDHTVPGDVRKQGSLCPSLDRLIMWGLCPKGPCHSGHLTVLGTRISFPLECSVLECPSSNLSLKSSFLTLKSSLTVTSLERRFLTPIRSNSIVSITALLLGSFIPSSSHFFICFMSVFPTTPHSPSCSPVYP